MCPSPWSSEEECSLPNKSGCESSVFPFLCIRHVAYISFSTSSPRMLWTPILALLLLPLTLVSAALESEHDKLVKLAAAGNGVIKLDESTFNLLTHPKRTWSAAIQFTAMDKRRRCNPCRCVPSFSSSSRPLIYGSGSSVLHGIPWQRLGSRPLQSTETPTSSAPSTLTMLSPFSRGWVVADETACEVTITYTTV